MLSTLVSGFQGRIATFRTNASTSDVIRTVLFVPLAIGLGMLLFRGPQRTVAFAILLGLLLLPWVFRSFLNDAKQTALERILGPMHEQVRHSIIPFAAGGAVDLYYFPDHIPGTGFATMELLEPDGRGPRPNRIGTYELVAFTRHSMPAVADLSNEHHPFDAVQRRVCSTLTLVGFYARDAVLNPGDTCEVAAKEGDPNRCLILDSYDPKGVGFTIDGRTHCLLLCMEVFRNEMEYAREEGGAALLDKLKAAGHYPYSDLDRSPVI